MKRFFSKNFLGGFFDWLPTKKVQKNNRRHGICRNRLIGLFTLCCVSIAQNAWAGGGIGYNAMLLSVNSGSDTWYNTYSLTWSYGACSPYTGLNSAPKFSDYNFTTNITALWLKGYAVVGWRDGGSSDNFVVGRLQYKVWRTSAPNPELEPSYSNQDVGNYGDCTGGVADVVCGSTTCGSTSGNCTNGNDQTVGRNNLNIGWITSSSPAGIYSIKVRGLGRLRYTGGDCKGWGDGNGSEITKTFTVPGFNPTTATIDFEDQSVSSQSTTKSTNYNAYDYNNGTVSQSGSLGGDNPGDFTITSINTTTKTVTATFTPSGTGIRTATLTLALGSTGKTMTITLTGNGITPCTAPSVFNISNNGSAVYSQGVAASTLTSSVSGGSGGVITYQWYVSDINATTGGTAVASGGTSSSFTPPTTLADVGTKYYYLVAKIGNCSTTSNNAIAISTMGACNYVPTVSFTCNTSIPRLCTECVSGGTHPYSAHSGGWQDQNHGSAGVSECNNRAVGAGDNTSWFKYDIQLPCSGTYKTKIRYESNGSSVQTSLRASSSATYMESLVAFTITKTGWNSFATSDWGNGSITTDGSGNTTFYLFPGNDTKIYCIDFEFVPSVVAGCVLPTAVTNAGVDKCVGVNTGVQLGATALSSGNIGLWEVKTKPASSNYTFSSNTAYNATFTADKTGEYVLTWKVMTPEGCTACDEMTVTVVDPSCATPSFNLSGFDTPQSSCLNGATPFPTLSVNNATGTSLSYQWYKNTTNNISGATIIVSETSNEYTPPNTEAVNYYYFCVITNSCSCGFTADATAASKLHTVNTLPATPTKDQGKTSVCANETGILYSVEDEGFTYEWSITNDAITSSTTGTSITVTAGTANYKVSVVAIANNCASAAAAEWNVAVNVITAGTATADLDVLNKEGNLGTTVTLSDYEIGADIQWQYSTDEVQWYDINGENENELETGKLLETTFFRAKVTDGMCTVYSNVVEIKVKTPITIYARFLGVNQNYCSINPYNEEFDHYEDQDFMFGVGDGELFDCGYWYQYNFGLVDAASFKFYYSDGDVSSEIIDVTESSKYVISERDGVPIFTDVNDVEYSETGVTIYAKLPKEVELEEWTGALKVKVLNDICGTGLYDMEAFDCSEDGFTWVKTKEVIRQTPVLFVISNGSNETGQEDGDTKILSFGFEKPFDVVNLVGESVPEKCTSTEIYNPQGDLELIIYSLNHKIFVVGAEQFTVYNITGKQVQNNNLLPGVYIVRIGNKAYKAMVK